MEKDVLINYLTYGISNSKILTDQRHQATRVIYTVEGFVYSLHVRKLRTVNINIVYI